MPDLLSQRTDDGWIADLRSGGETAERAYADLRDLLARGLRHALAGKRADGADIEDFAQEAAVRVGERLDGYRGESRFTTWAVAVAVRVAFTHMRRRRWGEIPLSQLADGDGLDRFEPSAAGGLPEADERARIAGVMRETIERHLTDRQRRVLLAELSGMPKERLAEELGITTNALYKSMHDARKALKAALAARGIHAEAVREAFGIASGQTGARR